MDKLTQKSGFDYNIDLVLCLDATGSTMVRSVLQEVKDNAPTFREQFVSAIADSGRDVDHLRVKVIIFKDMIMGAEAMVESEFFTLGEEGGDEAFCSFMDSVQPGGGGDIPENSLEALALAMKSDWTKKGPPRKHVIYLYTDAPALNLGDRAHMSAYPKDMPKDLGELHELWKGMDRRAKSMILYAVDEGAFSEIAYWDKTYFVPDTSNMKPGEIFNVGLLAKFTLATFLD